MYKFFTTIIVLLTLFSSPLWALTPDEVIRLKAAGVSDSVIETMIERGTNIREGSGVWETGNHIIYQAAPNNRLQRDNELHERWKEERSLDAVGNVIIDGRRPLPQQ